jgi:hypothetical protein
VVINKKLTKFPVIFTELHVMIEYKTRDDEKNDQYNKGHQYSSEPTPFTTGAGFLFIHITILIPGNKLQIPL